MCGPRADETPHGVRIFEGTWADGYLGRYPVRPGYVFVIWKGRHVAEPTELSAEESAGFWADVSRVAGAVDAQYGPAKMNWLSLGNGVQ
jgi:diadenosine tetraphosphate (Ap4A) HIT family hydrolase